MSNDCCNYVKIGASGVSVEKLKHVAREFGILVSPYHLHESRIFNDDDNNYVIYSIKLDTNWAPPIKELDIISIKYPDLLFDLYYWILGCGVCGDYKVKNGAVLLDKLYENDEYDSFFDREASKIIIQPADALANENESYFNLSADPDEDFFANLH